MSHGIFSPNFKETPYWWDASPLDESEPAPIGPVVDVLVVGAGYTGLCVALQTARGGKNTWSLIGISQAGGVVRVTEVKSLPE